MVLPPDDFDGMIHEPVCYESFMTTVVNVLPQCCSCIKHRIVVTKKYVNTGDRKQSLVVTERASVSSISVYADQSLFAQMVYQFLKIRFSV